jgi:hypothetical protein
MLCNVDGANECGFATNQLIQHSIGNFVSGKTSQSNNLRQVKKKPEDGSPPAFDCPIGVACVLTK